MWDTTRKRMRDLIDSFCSVPPRRRADVLYGTSQGDIRGRVTGYPQVIREIPVSGLATTSPYRFHEATVNGLLTVGSSLGGEGIACWSS